MLFGQYKFNFTRGECRVTASKIYLPCDSMDRFITDTTPEEMKGSALIVSIGFSILFFYWAFLLYNSGHFPLAIFTSLVAGFIVFKSIHPGKDYPPACEISKNEVTRISVSRGDGRYPRPKITIHFTRDGRERVAYLVFSIIYLGGEEEVTKALEVFKDQSWEVENEDEMKSEELIVKN